MNKDTLKAIEIINEILRYMIVNDYKYPMSLVEKGGELTKIINDNKDRRK